MEQRPRVPYAKLIPEDRQRFLIDLAADKAGNIVHASVTCVEPFGVAWNTEVVPVAPFDTSEQVLEDLLTIVREWPGQEQAF